MCARVHDDYRERVLAVAPMPAKKSLAFDALIGFALVAAGLVEVWTGLTDAGLSGWLLTVLGTAPVVLRRWLPVTSLVAVLVPLALLTVEHSDTFSFAHLLAMMVTVYTVAHECARGRALIGLALAVGSALANSAAAPGSTGGDFLFPVILLGGPWAAGRAMRAWGERARELQTLTEELRAQREESARLAVSAERAKIARDLHDSLAQSLHIVLVHAEAAEEALGKLPDQTTDSLHLIQSVARDALTQTKSMLGVLRAEGDHLDVIGQPKLADLDSLAESVRALGLAVDLRVDGAIRPLPTAVDASAYRIIQESLTNVLKHAQAHRAQVEVRYGPDFLELEVTDDGRGAVTADEGRGYGLLGMRERALTLGGRLTAGSIDGGGFGVRARLPVEVEAR